MYGTRKTHLGYINTAVAQRPDLDEPVDVYSAWIDACEDVNQQRRMKAAQKSRESRDDSRSPPPQSYSEDRLDPFDEDDEDDDY